MRVVDIFRVSLLVTVLATGAVDTSWSAQRPIMLSDAIDMALKKNEDIFIAKESAGAARASVSGAKGSYNPLLELSSGWRHTRMPANYGTAAAFGDDGTQTGKNFEASASLSQYLPTGGELSLYATTSRATTDNAFDPLSPDYLAKVGLSLRQPLLRSMSTDQQRLAVSVARTDQARSDAELRATVTDVVAAVERAYWVLAAARAEVEVREQAVRLAQEQLTQTEDRIQNGLAPETESSQPRAELERRRGELLASQETASRAETALKYLILADDDIELWQDSLSAGEGLEAEVTPVQRDEAMNRALAMRPELEAARAAIDRRKAERGFARSQTWPALDAVVSYDRYGYSGNANPEVADQTGQPAVVDPLYDGGWGRSWNQVSEKRFDDLSVGLVLSYPIGNSAARSGSAIARHAERQAEAGLQQVRKSVRADVLNALAALETAGQRIEAARAGREAAEIQLSVEQDRFAVGLSTNFLVLTRQNDLSSARLNEIESRTAYRIASIELERATGTLLEQHKIEIETSTN